MSTLNDLFDQVDAFKLAPLESWQPNESVEIDIRIASNGDWYYQGTVIPRHRIVKLFSTVLRLEDEEYFLVTPPVKYRIQVEDAPFTAVELNQKINERQQLFFRTNMDEVILADADHPIVVKTNSETGEPSPYIMVHGGLTAKIARPVFYELTDILEPDPKDSDMLGVFSDGQFFPFGDKNSAK